MSSSPHPYPWSLTLSRYEFRLVRVTAPLAPPLSRGTHSHGLLSTISSTTSYSGRQLLQGGWGEKKKLCVHCRLSRISSLARVVLGRAWHGHAGMACIIVSIQLFFYTFPHALALSLFIAGGCLASSVSLYTCTIVLCSCF